ncbi:MAG: GNAT family N-acetyltransferase [Pseudomonadota bacterium]
MKADIYPSIDALPSSARALLSDHLAANPFVSLPWLVAFEKHFTSQDRSAYVVLNDAEGALLVLPILEHRRFGVPVKLRPMSNFYSTFYAPPCRVASAGGPTPQELGHALAEFLSDHYRHFPLIEMAPLRGFGALWQGLLERLGSRGYEVRRYGHHVNRFENVEGDSFASYMARRPGALRSVLRRKPRVLARELGFQVILFEDRENMDRAVDHFEQIYEESWKESEASPKFIRAMCKTLAAEARLKLGILYSGTGDPIAGQIWFRIGEAWSVFKLAYRPQYSRYSPGSILMAALIESFFARGAVATLDFLSGDDPYKQDWVSQHQIHWGFEAVRRTHPLGAVVRAKRHLRAPFDPHYEELPTL